MGYVRHAIVLEKSELLELLFIAEESLPDSAFSMLIIRERQEHGLDGFSGSDGLAAGITDSESLSRAGLSSNTEFASYGSANAMTKSPCFVPSLPWPPAQITRYCLPLIE